MYVCNCGKGHELTDEQYALIDGIQELRLQHECGFDIIIGGEDHGPYDEESGFGGIYLYSFDTKDLPENEREARLSKAITTIGKIVPIRMKCGHNADWRGLHGGIVCCSKCAWDDNSRAKDPKAWEKDYEYMYPELLGQL